MSGSEKTKTKVNPEWTANYWQWIFSHPDKENPLKTGVVYDKDYAMLPCTGGGACDRKAKISKDKDILVPVFAAAQYGRDEMLVREVAKVMSTPLKDSMKMLVDGVPQDWEYIESKFKIDDYEAVSAGYWNRLRLSPGKHVVKFGGKSAENDFFTDNTYEIEID